MRKELKVTDTGIPVALLDYIADSWEEIKCEGELASVRLYGGSVFCKFKNGRIYRLSLSLYNSEVILDDLSNEEDEEDEPRRGGFLDYGQL